MPRGHLSALDGSFRYSRFCTTKSTETDQKEQIAAWNKQCKKVWVKYFTVVIPSSFLLTLPFILTLRYFLDVTVPLVSGELAYGEPGYYEYQAAKDQALIILAVLLVIIMAVNYFTHRWYTKLIRALGPPRRIPRPLEALGHSGTKEDGISPADTFPMSRRGLWPVPRMREADFR